MGLDTTHNAWHGPYSAFGRWRNTMAVSADYELVKDGQGWPVASAVLDRDWEAENYQGRWDSPPEDPLLLLLVHSDCDGVIEAKHCLRLAERLEGLLPKLPADDPYWLAKTQQFIDGLRRAAKLNEPLEFW